jgi:hypothetical protein
LDDGQTEIDANILFHRLIVLAMHEQDGKSSFSCELTPLPASLFKDGFMQKPNKSSLYTSSAAGPMDAQVPHGVVFVVDGVCLLHRVRWRKGVVVSELMTVYSQYVRCHFGLTAHVVFDGYSEEPSTKDDEHWRHSGKCSKISANMVIESST